MKRWLTMFFLLLTSFALAAPARADVMFSPVVIAVGVFVQILPWLLVVGVVAATWLLLRKFRRKK